MSYTHTYIHTTHTCAGQPEHFAALWHLCKVKAQHHTCIHTHTQHTHAQVNPNISQLSDTFARSRHNITQFGGVLALMILAFELMAHLMFGAKMAEYARFDTGFIATVQVCVCMYVCMHLIYTPGESYDTICVCVCVWAFGSAWMYTCRYVYVCMYVYSMYAWPENRLIPSVCVCVCVDQRVCIHVDMYVCVWMVLCVYFDAHVWEFDVPLYVCVRTHLHACIHAC